MGRTWWASDADDGRRGTAELVSLDSSLAAGTAAATASGGDGSRVGMPELTVCSASSTSLGSASEDPKYSG